MSNDTLNTATHTSDTPQLLLKHHLKELRPPTMLREYDHIARQCAVEQVDYQRYLLRMTELELLDRERRAMPSLNKTLALELPVASSSLVAKTCCCWATAEPARPTSRSRLAWLHANRDIACVSPPLRPWSAN